jgi:protein-disulfide isomerase
MMRTLLLTSMAALALAACGDSKTDTTKEQAAIAKVAAPAGKTWSQTVVKTPEGGYLMGNPNAPIKLVEYGSLTCSHCADFSTESHEELARDFVDTGRVSFEMRNYVRDPIDAIAAAVTHCAPVERYFPLTENTFASQAEIFANAQAAGPAGEAAMKLPPNQRFPALAKAMKLDAFFQARGLTAAQIDTCLGNIANIEALEKGVNAANEQYNIQGTPTFIINGAVAEGIGTWPVLRDRLKTMGAR